MDVLGIPSYKLNLKWNQSSTDVFLGLPFNIVMYAFLLELVSELFNFIPNTLVGSLSNVHLYDNVIEVPKEIMKHKVKKGKNSAKLKFNNQFNNLKHKFKKGTITITELISELRPEMFDVENYQHLGVLKGEMLTYSD